MRHRTTLIALALITLVSGLLYPISIGEITLHRAGHDIGGVTLFLLFPLLLAIRAVLPRLFSRR